MWDIWGNGKRRKKIQGDINFLDNDRYIIYVRRKHTFRGVNRDLHTTFGV